MGKKKITILADNAPLTSNRLNKIKKKNLKYIRKKNNKNYETF
jgi:hypothetical protein